MAWHGVSIPHWGMDTCGSALNTAMSASAVLDDHRAAEGGCPGAKESTPSQASVLLFGGVGRDQFGRTLLDVVKEQGRGVDTAGVATLESSPTAVCMCLSGRDDRAFVSTYGATAALTLADLDLSLLRTCTHLHICGYFMLRGLHEGFLHLLKELKAQGITLSLDTGFDPANKWRDGIHEVVRMMDLFFPNETEAMAISGKESVEEALEELTKDSDILVVITTGPQGAIAKQRGQVWKHAAYDVMIKDTTGAGDCFTGSFLAQYLQDGDVTRSLALGSAAGAMAVGREGVPPHPNRSALESFTKSHVLKSSTSSS